MKKWILTLLAGGLFAADEYQFERPTEMKPAAETSAYCRVYPIGFIFPRENANYWSGVMVGTRTIQGDGGYDFSAGAYGKGARVRYERFFYKEQEMFYRKFHGFGVTLQYDANMDSTLAWIMAVDPFYSMGREYPLKRGGKFFFETGIHPVRGILGALAAGAVTGQGNAGAGALGGALGLILLLPSFSVGISY